MLLISSLLARAAVGSQAVRNLNKASARGGPLVNDLQAVVMCQQAGFLQGPIVLLLLLLVLMLLQAARSASAATGPPHLILGDKDQRPWGSLLLAASQPLPNSSHGR